MSHDYRAEIWFSYAEHAAEDELEEQLRDFMKHNNMCVEGLVIYRIHRW